MNHNVDFFGSDKIQNPQYTDIQENPLTNNEFEAFVKANDDKINNLEIEFDHFQKQCEQMQDDLLNQMRNFMQNFQNGPPGEDKEHEATTNTELPSTKDIQPLPVQKPPQDSDIRQLIIEECCVEVPEQQKQKMEDMMLELVKICQEKEFLCIHDDEQEVKNVVEQPAERGNHSIQSLQNLKVVHKSSISFKNTSQISSIHSIAPIQSTKEPRHSLKDEIECDMPAKDVCSPVFTTFSNPLFKDNDNFDSNDDESLPDEDVPAEEFKIYLNPLCDEDTINSDKLDPHCFNVESDFVEYLLNRDTFINFSSKFDFSGELAHIKPEIPKSDFDFEEEIRLIENLLYDNSFPRPPEELNADIVDTIIESIPLLPIPVRMENPLIPRPPPKPPDVETNAGEEIADYPPEIEVILCWIYVRFLRYSYPLIDFSLGRSISF
nr:hypothetical protein [Tanacetum cinerariifolium]